ncbi:MAG TPA: TlyA family RNA methyltransferase, partial [Candidatus Saccharibacteria bacterium]|nr:TlyA family RNA methyltransferase [Candidatus Saccharibacteria bacterium]
DQFLAKNNQVSNRSQAENYIRRGEVTVNNQVITKPGYLVSESDDVTVKTSDRYVSRAGFKLASVAELMGVDFRAKTVLDVGSSTGGFTDYALQHGASKVYAVDVGTNQLHPSLRDNPKVELHEKTDIRDFYFGETEAGDDRWGNPKNVSEGKFLGVKRSAGPATLAPDIIVVDVSFISLRDVLPHIATHLANPQTQIVAMVKPQFEAGKHQTNKGVIKNENQRRQILKDFELWAKDLFFIADKRDSEVAGTKGNRERFYLLTLNRNSTTSPGRIT